MSDPIIEYFRNTKVAIVFGNQEKHRILCEHFGIQVDVHPQWGVVSFTVINTGSAISNYRYTTDQKNAFFINQNYILITAAEFFELFDETDILQKIDTIK